MVPLVDESYDFIANDDSAPDDQADRTETLARVMKLMDRLSDNQKQVILMKFRDGLSYREISDATGLTGGNVGFLIHTGLKKLRQIMPPDLGSAPQE